MANVTIQYTADIQQLNSKLDLIIQKQEQIVDGSKKAQKSISDASSQSADSLNKVTSSLTKVGAALGIAFSVKQIIEFTKTVFEAEKSMELLQNRLNFLAGSASSGEQMFTRLEAVSRRLGLNLNDTAEGLASFGIAAKQAGFSAQKSEKIFIQVATGLRAAGASSLQTQRAFYALQQMMSKGVVAAEELRRQLGESLPGASDLMTKAYNRLHPAANLTNIEFTKLLESGKIISKDILPVFAAVIEETFAPALSGKKNSLDASLNKVSNEILKLKLNLGNASWFKAGIDAISEGMFTLNAVMSSDKLSNLEKFNALMFSNLASEKLQKFVGAYDDIKTAIDEFNNKVEQAITTNKVFGDALEKQSENYKTYSTEQREATKRNTDAEIESNKVIIKSSQEKLKEYDKLIKATKEDFNEQIKVATFGKTKIQAYGIEQKMLKDLSNQIKNITDSRSEEEKKAITSLQNAESRNEFLKELLIEFYNLDEELRKKSQDDKEAADKAEQKRLEDEVARAKKRLHNAKEGSAEQTAADVNFAKKKKELDVFMQESTAKKDLAEVEGAKAVEKALSDGRVRDLNNLVAAESAKLAFVVKGTEEELIIRQKIILLQAKIASEGANLSEAQINALMEKAIDEIEELEARFNDSTFKQYQVAVKSGEKFANDLRKTFRDQLYGTISDPMELEIEKTLDYYNDLIREAKGNAKLIKQLETDKYKAIDSIRKKGNEQAIKEAARMVHRVGSEIAQMSQSFADAERDMMKNNIEASVNMLNAKLQSGLISEK